MRFNFSGKARQARRPTDTNYLAITTGRGSKAQWDLYITLLSLSLNEPLSVQREDRLSPIRKLIRENDPEFVAKLAIWLREKTHLRVLSFILTVELAALYPDKEWVGHLTSQLIQQAADIPAWLDYYTQVHGRQTKKSLLRGRSLLKGKSLSRVDRQVRKSLATLLNQMSEYQFVRYSRGEQVKLKYVLSLLQPKVKDKAQRVLFDKILADQLPVRSNWELELDALQRQHYDSIALKQLAIRDKWKELISSFRMGYPALLKNIQPILAAGVSGKVLKLAAEYLGNAAAVTKNKQLPFPLLETYRELKPLGHGGAGMLIAALEQAVIHSAQNLEGFEEDNRVLIAMDVSNSMKHPLRSAAGGRGGLIQRFDVGPLLAMSLQRRCQQVITGIVGNTWKAIDLPRKQILAGVDQFHSREGEAGYATNGHLVIGDLVRKEMVVDKILIFTDCQLWNSRPFNQPAGTDLRKLWGQYRRIAPQAKLYLFDLSTQGHTGLEIPEENVHLVSGWNDRVFEVLKEVENENDVIEMINNTKL